VSRDRGGRFQRRPTGGKDDGVLVRRILRLVPWPLRKRLLMMVQQVLLPLVAGEHRLRLARRIVPMSPPPRLRAGTPGALLRVRTGGGWLTARVDRAASPVAVRRRNLDRVVAALTSAGIDWFRVPARSLTHTAVAVPARDRARVVRLLAALATCDCGRLEAVAVRGRPPRRSRADVLRVYWPVTDPRGSLLLGADFGCDVEFWRECDDALVGPRPNPVADVVAVDAPVVYAAEPVFGPFASPADTAAYRTRDIFTLIAPDRVSFPIDAVYTWVDGDDPQWRRRKARALGENGWVAAGSVHSANPSRFTSRDELRYSLRALHYFAPWIRRVFVVTDDQVPAWLDTDYPGITVVSHRQIFGGTGRLPTFNSHAIECRLHRIPGLAEHFLYLNDDVFVGRPVAPELFFTPGGLARFFPSRAIVDAGPRRQDDPPVNSAAKNNRRLIREAFGRVLTRKMMHTPHPSRRSVITEIEERFAAEVAATASHQFRHPEDISLLSSLQQYYAYLTGRAAPGEIKYMYADLADPAAPFKMARVLRNRHLDAFCLNDTDADEGVAAEQEALLGDFLPAYLPFVAPFELAPQRVGRQLNRSGPVPCKEMVP
jgi:Stealth protein CR2, conserved region 2/Stealth protein CR3, conserved region 3/Stealth protein CR4, conserved region 4/Stealth protein CR1, conserved region 1